MQKVDLVLRHYNRIKPLNCEVISGDIKKIFTIKINKNENVGAEMTKGDPVLIGILGERNIFQVNGGYVVGATPNEDSYLLCSNEVVNIAKELDKRQYERYPVSLLSDIKLFDSGKRDSACIKDISYSGMGLYSESDLSINDSIEVTIYLNNSVTRFDGVVMRREVTFGRNEYGIQIIHRDKPAMEAAESQIFSLVQNEKEIMYRHMLSANYKL